MSSLTTETKEVWVVIRRDFLDNETELAEYDDEESAVERAHAELSWYIEQTKSFAICRIEHRIVPIYK